MIWCPPSSTTSSVEVPSSGLDVTPHKVGVAEDVNDRLSDESPGSDLSVSIDSSSDEEKLELIDEVEECECAPYDDVHIPKRISVNPAQPNTSPIYHSIHLLYSILFSAVL